MSVNNSPLRDSALKSLETPGVIPKVASLGQLQDIPGSKTHTRNNSEPFYKAQSNRKYIPMQKFRMDENYHLPTSLNLGAKP